MRSIRRIICALLLGALPAFAAPPLTTGATCDCPTVMPEAPGANGPPIWNLSARSIEQGDPCTYDLNAFNSDSNNDARVYSLVSGSLPPGCSLSGTSIVGTTTTPGAYTFVLGADDGQTTILRPAFTTAAALSFNSVSLTPALSNRASVQFTVTPIASNIDYLCGFSPAPATAYSSLLAIVRFNTGGTIDARGASAYASSNTVNYSGGNGYVVRMDFDFAASTYDVTANDTVVADNFQFRGAATPTSFDYVTCVDAATPGTVGTVSSNITLIQPAAAEVTWTVFSNADTTPPSAPAAPTVSGVTQTTVTLTLPTPEHHFDLYRSPSGCGAFALIASDLPAGTYTDTGLTQNTAYCYRLIEFDAADNASSAGSTANATTSAVNVNSLLSIADVSTTEGNSGTKSLTFTLTSSASQAFNIVCQYETQAGTADSATDFIAASGTVQIDSGTTTEQIAITINGDATVEPSETFTLRVFNCGQNGIAVNATEFTATGTITTDDGTPTIPTTATDTISMYEGDTLITWTLDEEYEVGYFANGDPFVVAEGGEVVVQSVSPAPSGGRNGSQKNPTVPGSQALDSRASAYNATGNGGIQSFPQTLVTYDSLISSVSQTAEEDFEWDGSGDDSHAEVRTAAILTVVPSAPPTGALRPSYADNQKATTGYYLASSINASILPRLSATGLSAPNSSGFSTPLARLKRGLQRPWLLWPSNFQARDIHPARNMNNYHREVALFLSELATYLASDLTIDDELLIYTVQLSIDYYHVGIRGNGDSSFWPWPILIGGKLLNNSNMLNLFSSGISNLRSVPRDFADFYIWSDPWRGSGNVEPGGPNSSRCANVSVPAGQTYLIGGKRYLVFFRNNLAANRDYEHLEPSERTACGMASNSDDSYRTSQDSHPHVGMVFGGLAFDMVDEWDHYATFAYIDRWMKPDGENRGTTVNAFIRGMYERHRSSFQSFDYLAP